MIFSIYGITLFAITICINICLYKKDKENFRESRLELLRIIAMIMIVGYHYTLHGSNFFNLEININKLILNLFIINGKIGVNLFIMISAYYLLRTKVTLEKVINLILKVKIYSIIFLIIFLYLDEVSLVNLIGSIFPVLYSFYWFISAYLIFYITSPLLNKFFISFEKDLVKKTIIVSIIIFSIFSHLFKAFLFYSVIIWFFNLYMIVYYISNYIDVQKISINKLKIISFISFFLIYLSILIFDILGKYSIVFKSNIIYFTLENSILVLVFSISFFLIFLKLPPIKSKVINYVAKAILGIYLIHDNRLFRSLLYYKILDNSKYINENWLILLLHSIFSIILIFSFGICIDQTMNMSTKKISNLIQIRKIEKIIKQILEKSIQKLEKYEK